MIPSDRHTISTTTPTTTAATATATATTLAKRDSTDNNNQTHGLSQHGNEFVSLLKGTTGTSASNKVNKGRRGSFSPASFSSAASSSIEDLFAALKQHERRQQEKQKQKQNQNQNQKQRHIQTQIQQKANSTMSEASAKVDSPRASPVAHTTPPQQATENNAKPGASGNYTSVTPGPLGEITTDSSSASSDDATTEEEEVRLFRRLETKRREIDEEIEAFRFTKEEEYAEYEQRLRERWRRKKEKRDKTKKPEATAAANGEQEARDMEVKHSGSTLPSSSTQNSSQSRSGILKEQSHFDEELPFAISSPAALMALNEQHSAAATADPLTSEVTLPQTPTPRAQTSETSDPPEVEGSKEKEVKEEKDKSPPFEEEIQRAGLFTPTYLPLLDDTYSRASPIATPPRPIIQARPHSEPLAQSQSYTRPASPGPPLASSLKHSSSYSSGFSSGSGPRHLKPKSPKRVSFKLDEAKPVPSRSTPPQTVLTFGDDDDASENLDAVGIEQVETLDIRGPVDAMGASPRSTAPLFGSKMTGTTLVPELQQEPSVNSSYRDSLVVPTRISDGVVEVAGGGLFRDGGISPRTDDHDWESVDRVDVNGSGFGSVDDDEDLFDMDETLPISPSDEDCTGDPNIRSQSPDFEEAIWTGVAAPNDVIATPHGLREAASLPKYSPISSFGSLGIQQSQLPSTGRRGSVPFNFENLERVGAVPGSLPVRGNWLSSSTSLSNGSSGNGNGNGNGRKMNGGFRRKSVQKYVDEEPDAPPPPTMKQDWSSKGKSIEGGMRFHSEPLLEEEEEDVVVPPTTFGSSLPMAIQGRERERLRKVAKVVHAAVEEELSPGTSRMGSRRISRLTCIGHRVVTSCLRRMKSILKIRIIGRTPASHSHPHSHLTASHHNTLSATVSSPSANRRPRPQPAAAPPPARASSPTAHGARIALPTVAETISSLKGGHTTPSNTPANSF
ncbi:hypothetical protein BGX38DRAFT_1167920 [Terfezia claveryi]|nr:hypothetical protein BGX38DRAFT_1167920 [Terfezia claveryi]